MKKFKIFLSMMLILTLCSCSGVFYQPDRVLHFEPSKLGYQPQDIFFKAQDGVLLHSWYFPVKSGKPKGTIIQFHGNAENLSSHYISLVWLVDQGYQLFVFDYRGYGRSEGSPNQKGTHLDALAAMDQAWKIHQESRANRFVVYGQSLGGLIAMRAFPEFKEHQKTALVVMDSTFMSYQDVAQEKLASFWLTWIFSPLGQVLVSDAYASGKAVEGLKNRLLVIHDKNDPVISFENGEEIFKLASCVKDFWTYEKEYHVGVFALNMPENRERFVKLLDSL